MVKKWLLGQTAVTGGEKNRQLLLFAFNPDPDELLDFILRHLKLISSFKWRKIYLFSKIKKVTVVCKYQLPVTDPLKDKQLLLFAFDILKGTGPG